MHSITVGRILTVRIWNFSVLRAHTHWNAIHIHNTLMLINYTIYLQNLETQCFKPCLRYFAICMTIITLFNAMWWGTCTCDGKNVQNWYRIVSCQVSMPSRWERGWWSPLIFLPQSKFLLLNFQTACSPLLQCCYNFTWSLKSAACIHHQWLTSEFVTREFIDTRHWSMEVCIY